VLVTVTSWKSLQDWQQSRLNGCQYKVYAYEFNSDVKAVRELADQDPSALRL
jgi:hypothetical protein